MLLDDRHDALVRRAGRQRRADRQQGVHPLARLCDLHGFVRNDPGSLSQPKRGCPTRVEHR
jgi:hypothetical protein